MLRWTACFSSGCVLGRASSTGALISQRRRRDQDGRRKPSRMGVLRRVWWTRRMRFLWTLILGFCHRTITLSFSRFLPPDCSLSLACVCVNAGWRPDLGANERGRLGCLFGGWVRNNFSMKSAVCRQQRALSGGDGRRRAFACRWRQ